MKTDIAKEVIVIAKRVLENVELGRVYPTGTVEWANRIVTTNAPAPAPKPEDKQS